MAVSATALALTRRAAGSFFVAGVLWTGLVVGVAAALGIALAVTDHPPHDFLHVVYGVLAAGVMPGAALVSSGRSSQRQTVVWAIAWIVLSILILRLFQTGG